MISRRGAGAGGGVAWEYTRRIEVGAPLGDFRRHLSGREGRLDALVSRTEVVRVSKGLSRGTGIVISCKMNRGGVRNDRNRGGLEVEL